MNDKQKEARQAERGKRNIGNAQMTTRFHTIEKKKRFVITFSVAATTHLCAPLTRVTSDSLYELKLSK